MRFVDESFGRNEGRSVQVGGSVEETRLHLCDRFLGIIHREQIVGVVLQFRLGPHGQFLGTLHAPHSRFGPASHFSAYVPFRDLFELSVFEINIVFFCSRFELDSKIFDPK